jgi:hypothetical protein
MQICLFDPVLELVTPTTVAETGPASGAGTPVVTNAEGVVDASLLPADSIGITALTGAVVASGVGSVAAALSETGVEAGSYTNASFQVGADGRITSAESGTAGGVSVTKVELEPTAPGNFTVPHGLGVTPTLVTVQMTSDGNIWLQNTLRWDATNIYLTASDEDVTGFAACFH